MYSECICSPFLVAVFFFFSFFFCLVAIRIIRNPLWGNTDANIVPPPLSARLRIQSCQRFRFKTGVGQNIPLHASCASGNYDTCLAASLKIFYPILFQNKGTYVMDNWITFPLLIWFEYDVRFEKKFKTVLGSPEATLYCWQAVRILSLIYLTVKTTSSLQVVN